MTESYDFQPIIGHMRDRGLSRPFAHQVIAAMNRAGVRYGAKSKFTGSRIGRGGAAGVWLSHRGQHAALRQRRVIVKGRIVKLAGKGMGNAAAHLRYVQREGVTRDGERGKLYSANLDRTDSKTFLDKAEGDRHQFRFIVAPEDGIEYGDLKTFTRNLMSRMEKDLGTHLDWVAADHYNTGHPHVHIIVRGKDALGKDLIIARDYMTVGIRERAAQQVSLDLGPRSDNEIREQFRAEMTAERLTSLDKQLLSMEDTERVLSPFIKDHAQQTLLMGRLRHLERMGLAVEGKRGKWQLEPGIEDTLRRMGERGDIIKTLHREMTERNVVHSPCDYNIYDPTYEHTKPLTGRVIARGLADEHNDRHYLIVDTMDGQAVYVDIGLGSKTGPTPEGSIIRITPKRVEPRQVDHTVAEVAAKNGGRYNVDLHLKHDPSATENFAETHIRRLEAIRKVTRGVEREPNGTWMIAPDHLERAADYERALAKQTPVIVDRLSSLSIDRQITANGATWLDRDIIMGPTKPISPYGFGKDVRDALWKRQEWLIDQGLATQQGEMISYKRNLLSELERRELSQIAGQISKKSGLRYAPMELGSSIGGTVSKILDLASGKFALIENSREFSLVPWRPILEKQIGREVFGRMRTSGIDWEIGRQRGLEI